MVEKSLVTLSKGIYCQFGEDTLGCTLVRAFVGVQRGNQNMGFQGWEVLRVTDGTHITTTGVPCTLQYERQRVPNPTFILLIRETEISGRQTL